MCLSDPAAALPIHRTLDRAASLVAPLAAFVAARAQAGGGRRVAGRLGITGPLSNTARGERGVGGRVCPDRYEGDTVMFFTGLIAVIPNGRPVEYPGVDPLRRPAARRRSLRS